MIRRLWLARAIVVVAVLAIAVLGFASPVEAKSLNWTRWDSEIWINKDGTFSVRETYEIAFLDGPFHFGYRNIPISQFTEIANVSVSEGAIAYTENRSEGDNTFYWGQDGDQYVINWYYPSTQYDSRVFTVQYMVFGGLIINDKVGDRFFWKAVGPEHAFPIESSTVTAHMPPGAKIDTSMDPFFSGVDAEYVVSADQTSVTYYARNIPADQFFEVGVRFPNGFVPNVKPSWQAAYEQEQAWNDQGRPIMNLVVLAGGTLLLLVGLLGIYMLWLIAGRDPDIGPVPEYLAEPPSTLPPGLAGTLVDESADLQDIMATLVDLARRGALDMEEHDRAIFGISVSKEFTFHKRGDFAQPLRDYETMLVSSVFGSSSSKNLADLKEKFYSSVPRIQDALYKEAVKEALFPASPKAVRGRYMGFGVAGLIVAAGLFFCVAAPFADRVDTLLCPFVSLGVVSLTLIGVSGRMPAKTRKGAEEAAKWRAFKTYLQNIERYADLRSVSSKFETHLPYAIAFGLERSWINKFARVADTPMPGWYFPVGMPYRPGMARAYGGGVTNGGMMAGPGGSVKDLSSQAARPGASLDGMSNKMFSGLNSMSAGLFTMLNSTSSAFTSVPHTSSSGGGGFSGGGFSSGGGGGGGGAGFG